MIMIQWRQDSIIEHGRFPAITAYPISEKNKNKNPQTIFKLITFTG